jgi:hypothetical protein
MEIVYVIGIIYLLIGLVVADKELRENKEFNIISCLCWGLMYTLFWPILLGVTKCLGHSLIPKRYRKEK